ncbi:MAG: alkaline phosphatase D family protein [Bacteroidetes bacterium]|nr:alkaline phosphatase D family protein [Bacteroidota bacterium]
MISKKITMLFIILVLFACGRKESNDLFRQPVVGVIQNNQVPVLIKTIAEGEVRIEYKSTDESAGRFTEWEKLSENYDNTTNLILTDLNPNTEYNYRVEFEDGNYSKWFKFKTFPEQGVAGKFNFIFSACLREKYMGFNIFEKIEQSSPSFVALLGDQMYSDYDGNLNELERYLNNDSIRQAMVEKGEIVLDDITVLGAFRNKYNRVYGVNFQNMASSIPLMAIWDDHDYGLDNSDGTYPYKKEARKVFKENFPDYSFVDEDGGIYYKFSIADVDFFVLDTRWYRSPMQNEDGELKTMLGSEQLEWLLNELKNSNAKFKIVFSSVPSNDYGGDTSSGRDGFDSWMGYTFERNKILSFIEKNQIYGVMIFSGDQHYPSAHILNWKSPLNYVSKTDNSIEYSFENLGTAVFDFSASPLSYRKTTGHFLIPANQGNPRFSYEIFRPEWAMPEKVEYNDDIIITSVYGAVEIDTESSPANVSVKFYDLNSETSKMVEIYSIKVTY